MSKLVFGFSRHHAVWLKFGEYLGLVVLATLSLFWLYDLWWIDLGSPITSLSGDAMTMQSVVFKAAIDTSSIWKNGYLGAPFGLDLRDYPQPDLVILGVTRALALVTDNHIWLRNVVVLGSFPAMALVSLYAMRRMGVSYLISVAASLLFAFSSFRHWRTGAHVFIALGYFTVPVVVLLAFHLATHQTFILAEGSRPFRFRWLNCSSTYVSLAWCVVMGVSGSVYFPFYSCILLAVAALYGASRNASWLPLGRGVVAIGTIVGALVLSFLPTILNNYKHGAVPVVMRTPEESERYGLKIAQLLLPTAGHKIPVMQALGDYYNSAALLVTENKTAYLGVVGGLGFLVLIFTTLLGRRASERLQVLGVLNIASVLLGTIGGFASIFAFLVSPTIRSHNRICVYIGYFSLVALALLVQKLHERHRRSWGYRVGEGIALTGITVFGLYDQYAFTNDYGAFATEFRRDEAFIRDIEGMLPKGSSIFQYPRFPFPENGPVRHLEDYAQFSPYLHSRSLRWSYGGIKGRRGDAWGTWIESSPAKKAVESLVFAGFSGIYVARDGYDDHAQALEKSLAEVLGSGPTLVSEGKTVAFFDLSDAERRLKGSMSKVEFHRRSRAALSPLYLGWLDGFYPADGKRNCAKSEARFVIHNPDTESRAADFRAHVAVVGAPGEVRIESDIFRDRFRVSENGREFSTRLEVPPGEHFMTVVTAREQSQVFDFGRRVRVCFENVEFHER